MRSAEHEAVVSENAQLREQLKHAQALKDQATLDAINTKHLWDADVRNLREALARVEAERDWWKEQRDILADYCRRADERARTAQAQLAEAVGLLRDVYLSVASSQRIYEFIERHAQAEQQEAQGAQAGDEQDQVHQLAFEIGEPDEDGDGYHFSADQLDDFVAKLNRAALATQPAAGTTSDQYRAELYDEVWQKARDMGYGNVTYALVALERMKDTQPAASEPTGWVPCSPELLASGVCCATAPRLPGEEGSGISHYHPAPPAAAHGDEAERIDARLLELYQAPFRFDERGGYIWDAQNNMVADNHVDGDQAMRVRGWGRLSYRQDGEEVQDLMGQAMADALTARWEAAMRAQAGEGGEV